MLWDSRANIPARRGGTAEKPQAKPDVSGKQQNGSGSDHFKSTVADSSHKYLRTDH